MVESQTEILHTEVTEFNIIVHVLRSYEGGDIKVGRMLVPKIASASSTTPLRIKWREVWDLA